jgi:hypothetical protein
LMQSHLWNLANFFSFLFFSAVLELGHSASHFLCRHATTWAMLPASQYLLSFPKLLVSYSESCWSVFPIFSCSRFTVLGLTLQSLIHFELIFVQSEDGDVVSTFYTWISSFASTTH